MFVFGTFPGMGVRFPGWGLIFVFGTLPGMGARFPGWGHVSRDG